MAHGRASINEDIFDSAYEKLEHAKNNYCPIKLDRYEAEALLEHINASWYEDERSEWPWIFVGLVMFLLVFWCLANLPNIS